MRTQEYLRIAARVAATAILLLMLSLCLSCASLTRGLNGRTYEHETVLEIQHIRSSKPSDCLAVCVGMVLKYYGVETIVPDTVLPLEMISLSRSLNTATPVDDEGHVLFATVLQLTPEELEPHVNSCGFYRNKARNIVFTCRALLEKFGGEVPSRDQEVSELSQNTEIAALVDEIERARDNGASH